MTLNRVSYSVDNGQSRQYIYCTYYLDIISNWTDLRERWSQCRRRPSPGRPSYRSASSSSRSRDGAPCVSWAVAGSPLCGSLSPCQTPSADQYRPQWTRSHSPDNPGSGGCCPNGHLRRGEGRRKQTFTQGYVIKYMYTKRKLDHPPLLSRLHAFSI